MFNRLHTDHWQDWLQHNRLSKFMYQSPIDTWLTLAIMSTLIASNIILYSASNHRWVLIEHQLLHTVIGLGLMLVLSQIKPHIYYRISYPLLAVTVLMLMATLFLGHSANGAKRWLMIAGVTLQPSEIAKLALPLALARYMHSHILPIRYFSVMTIGILIMVPTILVLKQPDLGTSLTLLLSGGIMLLLAGLSWRWLAGGAALLAASAPWIWHHLHTYQRNRLITFLNPEKDPLGTGYHIIQSKIALGAGGLWGQGWMSGSQAQLNFLPEHHTDFIFAVIGEEWGLMGCLATILLIFSIMARGWVLAYQADDTFRRLLIGTLALHFGFCALINMAMVCGIMPVVGIPLPIFSYGGSSITSLLAGMGIVMSLALHRHLMNK